MDNNMKIEHIGLSVSKPITMANWYVEHLGFIIRRQDGNDQKGLAFISDAGQETMLELFDNNVTPPLEGYALSLLAVHIAVSSQDPEVDMQRLIKAGAVYMEGDPKKAAGDVLVLLRDPWGNTIQLAKRAKAF
jgi:glyoxylase I family protein